MTTRETRAFCRTTTCDPNDPNAADACERDADGCATNGFELYWAPACISFSVQQDGSTMCEIPWWTLHSAVGNAYFNWTHADCGGGRIPSLQVFLRSPVFCSQVQYNTGANQPNASIWMFRDQNWSHQRSALALTTVTYATTTGEIYDADIELNSDENDITVGDEWIGFDLQSIVQHESGHTLGLDHSPSLLDATMFPDYSQGEIKKRSLSGDDATGICAVYPPAEDRGACDPSPRHGFSGECTGAQSKGGCAFERPVRTGLSGVGGLGLALVGAWGWRWRRRRARS
jgi:hypothetical protein